MTTKAKDRAETAQSVGMETLESVVAMSAQAAAEGYKNAAQFSKEHLEATKSGYEKFAAFGKGNLEAYSAASDDPRGPPGARSVVDPRRAYSKLDGQDCRGGWS